MFELLSLCPVQWSFPLYIKTNVNGNNIDHDDDDDVM